MTAVVTDFNQFTELRAMADRKDPAALREVAEQFEALFLQMMMKNMRAASFGDPIMGDNKQHELYRDMMDKQLALEMSSGKGVGLADMIVEQLGGDTRKPRERPADFMMPAGRLQTVRRATEPGSAVVTDASALSEIPGSEPVEARRKPEWSDPESFAKTVWPHVKKAARALNVSPVGILAQAALETGWGSHVMPDSQGGSSLNLFGIKAGRSWQGDTVTKRTLEFDGQVAYQESARFRSYENIGQTLEDYTNFIANNPRYADVRNSDIDGFANALQDNGYATDPKYADKIKDIFNGPTMKRVLSTITATD